MTSLVKHFKGTIKDSFNKAFIKEAKAELVLYDKLIDQYIADNSRFMSGSVLCNCTLNRLQHVRDLIGYLLPLNSDTIAGYISIKLEKAGLTEIEEEEENID